MGSHFSSGPIEITVAVTSSFPRNQRGLTDALPVNRKTTYNVTLASPARGVFIGGTENYNLFVRESGASPGEITPYLDIAGGIWHPISIVEIVDNDTYETNAPNILLGF